MRERTSSLRPFLLVMTIVMCFAAAAVAEEGPYHGICALSQGYWANHGPGAPGNQANVWPCPSSGTCISLGTVGYTQPELKSIFDQPVSGNGLVSLAQQLIAAKFNNINWPNGNVTNMIADADAMIGGLVVPPVGGSISSLDPATTSALVTKLARYNTGFVPCTTCSEPDVILLTPPQKSCANDTLTASATYVPGANYAWTMDGCTPNSATGPTASFTCPAGTHDLSVSVTKDGWCHSTSASTSITIFANPDPHIDANGPTTFCEGGSVTLSVSGSGTFEWFRNGLSIGSGSSIVVTKSGSYTVTATENGCSGTSAAVDVTENPTPHPTIQASGDLVFCEPKTLTLTASAAVSYQWSVNGHDIDGATGQTLVVSASGTYTVTVVDGNGCTGASDPTTVVVHPNPLPVISHGDLSVCEPGTVTLTAPEGGVHYQWLLDGDPIDGATDQTYVASVSGLYAVAVTNNFDCERVSSSVTVTIKPNPKPTVTPNGDTTFCDGLSVLLTSSSATGNQWYRNGSPIPGATNNTLLVTTSGTYSVVVTSENGCSRASGDTVVTVNPRPTPTISAGGPTTFCTGGSVTLTASAASSYQWLLNGSPIDGATGQTLVASGSGSYSVVATNEFGCSATSAAVTVTANSCANTFTQGAWGSSGGSGSGLADVQALLSSGNLALGSGGKTFTVKTTDAPCVIQTLPGGGTAAALPTGAFTYTSNCGTSPSSLLKNGKLNNVLLGQTITLGLNLRKDAGLGSITLCASMTTQGTMLVGSVRTLNPNSAPLTVSIPAVVLTYASTPAALLNFASNALGGVLPANVTLAQVNQAVDAVNRAFDGNRMKTACN